MSKRIPARRCPSIASLMQIKDVTEDHAKRVREVWHTFTVRNAARERIDSIIATSGVEYLGRHKRSGEAVYYCNAGDTYATTILFVGPVMRVGCWGDLVERNLIKEV